MYLPSFHNTQYANRTTPQEDVADLKRIIRRVEAAVGHQIHPSGQERAETARDLLPVLRRALRQAETKGQHSFRLLPAEARAMAAAAFITTA